MSHSSCNAHPKVECSNLMRLYLLMDQLRIQRFVAWWLFEAAQPNPLRRQVPTNRTRCAAKSLLPSICPMTDRIPHNFGGPDHTGCRPVLRGGRGAQDPPADAQ